MNFILKTAAVAVGLAVAVKVVTDKVITEHRRDVEHQELLERLDKINAVVKKTYGN